MSRRKPSRRDSKVALPTVVTFRASVIGRRPKASSQTGPNLPSYRRARNCVPLSAEYSARAVLSPGDPMPATRFDVLGIGNAIVDVLARTEDDFLIKQKMHKGSMQLIDEARAQSIYDAMGPAIEISGGSAATTTVGVASLGARAAFVGRVKDDERGRVSAHDIRAAGVTFETAPASDGPSTARSYILVTPDGERTMNTFLGAAQDLHPNDIDADTIAAAEITYLEGYLWDPPHAKEAFLKAAGIAHGAGRLVALTLAAGFSVRRCRAPFLILRPKQTSALFSAYE